MHALYSLCLLLLARLLPLLCLVGLLRSCHKLLAQLRTLLLSFQQLLPLLASCLLLLLDSLLTQLGLQLLTLLFKLQPLAVVLLTLRVLCGCQLHCMLLRSCI